MALGHENFRIIYESLYRAIPLSIPFYIRGIAIANLNIIGYRI